MTTTVYPELGFMTTAKQTPATKPQIAQAGCLQEQFTGPVPVRIDKPMSEILKERLAEADPASPSALFIP